MQTEPVTKIPQERTNQDRTNQDRTNQDMTKIGSFFDFLLYFQYYYICNFQHSFTTQLTSC